MVHFVSHTYYLCVHYVVSNIELHLLYPFLLSRLLIWVQFVLILENKILLLPFVVEKLSCTFCIWKINLYIFWCMSMILFSLDFTFPVYYIWLHLKLYLLYPLLLSRLLICVLPQLWMTFFSCMSMIPFFFLLPFLCIILGCFHCSFPPYSFDFT